MGQAAAGPALPKQSSSSNRQSWGAHVAQFERGQEIPGTRCSVDRLIGRGGYGEVYLCEHVVLRRRTVVKVLHANLCDRDDLMQRMLLEAQTLARLQQPNIVQVSDAGMTAETPARPFLVMEYLRGETLAQVLAYPEFARGIELYYSLQIGGELADGLRAAHEHGVIHRDLKPANIFLARTREDRNADEDPRLRDRPHQGGSPHDGSDVPRDPAVQRARAASWRTADRARISTRWGS